MWRQVQIQNKRTLFLVLLFYGLAGSGQTADGPRKVSFGEFVWHAIRNCDIVMFWTRLIMNNFEMKVVMVPLAFPFDICRPRVIQISVSNR